MSISLLNQSGNEAVKMDNGEIVMNRYFAKIMRKGF